MAASDTTRATPRPVDAIIDSEQMGKWLLELQQRADPSVYVHPAMLTYPNDRSLGAWGHTTDGHGQPWFVGADKRDTFQKFFNLMPGSKAVRLALCNTWIEGYVGKKDNFELSTFHCWLVAYVKRGARKDEENNREENGLFIWDCDLKSELPASDDEFNTHKLNIQSQRNLCTAGWRDAKMSFQVFMGTNTALAGQDRCVDHSTAELERLALQGGGPLAVGHTHGRRDPRFADFVRYRKAVT